MFCFGVWRVGERERKRERERARARARERERERAKDCQTIAEKLAKSTR